MDFSDQIELGHIVYLKNEEGYSSGQKFVPERIVYGEVQSVSRTEFYKAQAVGKELAATVQLWADEYHKNGALRYKQQIYNIERVYKKEDFVSLSCTLLALKGEDDHADRSDHAYKADGPAGEVWGSGQTGTSHAQQGSSLPARQHSKACQGT